MLQSLQFENGFPQRWQPFLFWDHLLANRNISSQLPQVIYQTMRDLEIEKKMIIKYI